MRKRLTIGIPSVLIISYLLAWRIPIAIQNITKISIERNFLTSHLFLLISLILFVIFAGIIGLILLAQRKKEMPKSEDTHIHRFIEIMKGLTPFLNSKLPFNNYSFYNVFQTVGKQILSNDAIFIQPTTFLKNSLDNLIEGNSTSSNINSLRERFEKIVFSIEELIKKFGSQENKRFWMKGNETILVNSAKEYSRFLNRLKEFYNDMRSFYRNADWDSDKFLYLDNYLKYEREDSPINNSILAEQLQVLKDIHEFELKKEASFSEPIFRFNGGSLGRANATFHFVNKGGPIKKVSIIPKSNFNAKIIPDNAISSEEKFNIILTDIPQPPPDKVIFEVQFENKLGKGMCKRFQYILDIQHLRIEEIST